MTTSEAPYAVEHPRFARMLDRESRLMEERGVREHRQRLVSGLAGRVIEIGAGNGLTFPYYPASVTEVVAVEPEPFLRARALQASRDAPVPVTVVDGIAEALPFESVTFHAGVASLVLCSVRDQARALGELRRVIRRGGELRFYEHIRSKHPVDAILQRAVDLLWPRLAGGCHTSRDTREAIRAAGFTIEECDEFLFRPLRFVPKVPHILGCARRT